MKNNVDPHVLYEASVQGTDVDIALFEKIFRNGPGRKPMTLREDFCGTALLARDWVASHPHRSARGIDLHRPTLDWARKHRLSTLPPEDQQRICLQEGNVLEPPDIRFDLIAALNFSYMIFRERQLLLQYFRSVYACLEKGGVFVLDLFGGPHAQQVMTEQKTIPAGHDVEGTPYPAFTYFWEQTHFNAVDQSILCHIHFRSRHFPPHNRAFTYRWRLWSINELRDLLTEAGFKQIDCYFEGWSDAHGSTDGVLRKRTRYEGMDAWVAYLAAHR